jgi:hypothetical protein
LHGAFLRRASVKDLRPRIGDKPWPRRYWLKTEVAQKQRKVR